MLWLMFICFPFVIVQAQRKYHQDDYTVAMERVVVADYNRSYVRNFTVNYVHYNRTYRAVNGTGYLLQDVRNNSKVAVQFYKFLSNEYRFFPLTMEIDPCKELVRDTFGIRESYQKCFNQELRCPFKKGFYKLTYGAIDYSHFPPYIPAGQYKIEVKIFHNSNFIFHLDYYAKFDEVLKKWETYKIL